MTGFVVISSLLVLAAILAGILLLRRGGAHRRPTRVAAAPAPATSPHPSTLAGDDVRFTVYRPSVVGPARWYQLVVFAHRIDEPTAPASPSSRAERVRQEAARVLGRDAAAYVALAEDSAVAIPREGQLTFVPEVAGFRFNPPRASMDWLEDVQNVTFRMAADDALDGTTARGRLTVWWGTVLLAEMTLVIRVSSTARDEETASESTAPFRKVFASYSRKDAAVVHQLEAYARALGDQYLIDVASIRAGERWQPRIEQLIEEADVFQLFWSWNSIRSDYVQREWRHALSLGRENFVRPVYWEEPLPQLPEQGLPPDELRLLQFQRVPLEPQPNSSPQPVSGPARVSSPSPRRRMTPAWLTAAATVILAVGAATLILQARPDMQPVETLPAPPPVVVPEQPNEVRPAQPTPGIEQPPTAAGPGSPRPDTATTMGDVVVSRFPSPRGDPELERFARRFVGALRAAEWEGRVVVLDDTARQARALALERGAGWVLSGQIDRDGSDAVITARLTNIEANTVAWSDVLRVPLNAPLDDAAAHLAQAVNASIR